MAEKRSYYHWLDGLYVLREWNAASAPDRLREAERLLKLRLLLGDLVRLSDIQLIDSPVVLDAFLDPEFVKLVDDLPDLIDLKAKPLEGFTGERAIAFSGLGRALDSTWVSTYASHPARVKKLADIILEDEIDEDWRTGSRLSAFLDAQPLDDEGRRLRGIAEAVSHFVHGGKLGPGPSEASRVAPRSFYEVLQDARDAPAVHPDAAKIIDDTVQWVETVDDLGARHRRSGYQATLQAQGWPKEFEPRWQTLLAAWNTAVSMTLEVDRSGVRRLSDGVLISFVLGEPLELIGPARGGDAQPVGARAARGLNAAIAWDVNKLSWQSIRGILRNTEVSAAQADYRRQLTGNDKRAQGQAAERMVRLIAEEIRRQVPIAIEVTVPSVGIVLLNLILGMEAAEAASICLPAAVLGNRPALRFVAGIALQSVLSDE